MDELPKNIKDIILYTSPIIKTALAKRVPLIFADNIASGRPSPIIEKYITTKVLPYYSNTHSNAYCGILMKNMITDTKNTIRKMYKIDKSKKIIFRGSGCTGAINHLIGCLRVPNLPMVHIFMSIYEHHSNYLPWIEWSNNNKNITIHTIPIDDNFNIDFNWLDTKLKQINTQNSEHVCIVSITACSNVTGIHVDTAKAWDIVQKNNTICKTQCQIIKSNLLFLDYACSAPYVEIDGTKCDAFYLSPHKYLGGIQTPGLLVADRSLFIKTTPYEPGGGCVEKVCAKQIIYSKDVEKRESAGTPNIIGIIRIGKVLELTQLMRHYIHTNEKYLSQYVFARFNHLKKTHPGLIVIMPELSIDNRLPVVCFGVKDMHYNYLVVLLNDLFGIQTRGGVSCTGLLAEMIEKMYGIKGWCRITFTWLMDQKEVDYIIQSVDHVVGHGLEYKNKYKYDEKANLYSFAGSS